MRTLYAGGRVHASAGAVAWFKKMGAGWDPDKLDGVAMVAEQIAAKRESDPMFSDLPVTVLTRDVITAFAERIEIDEEQKRQDRLLEHRDRLAESIEKKDATHIDW